MAGTRIRFDNAAGVTLAGILDRPAGPVSSCALFAHCFTCSKDLKAVRHLAASLNAAGIAVLRFDFTGLGQSEGEFADTTFSVNVEDLVSAAGWMRDNALPPALLIGHSLGGAAVLAAAASIPEARAIATIGAPSTPAHVKKLFATAADEIEEAGEAEVDLGGRPFTIRKQFVDDLGRHGLPDCIGTLRKPLLVMHAPLDTIVSIDNAGEIFAAAKHPKSFVSLDDADHLLSREADARYAGRVLAAWASRYTVGDEAADGDEDASHAVVARTPAGGFRTDLVASGHRLVADEPVSYGGSDLGPTPYDLLAAALASCTTMTMQVYARHKKLDLKTAGARVTHSKVHAKDCEDCETSEGRIDEFRRELTIEGDLSEEQRQRIAAIADRCPVHRTLHGEIRIRTTLSD